MGIGGANRFLGWAAAPSLLTAPTTGGSRTCTCLGFDAMYSLTDLKSVLAIRVLRFHPLRCCFINAIQFKITVIRRDWLSSTTIFKRNLSPVPKAAYCRKYGVSAIAGVTKRG